MSSTVSSFGTVSVAPDTTCDSATLTTCFESAARKNPGLLATTRSGYRHPRTVLGSSNNNSNDHRNYSSFLSPVEQRPTECSGRAALCDVNHPAHAVSNNGGTSHAPVPSLRYRVDLEKAVIHFMFERLSRPVEQIVVPCAPNDATNTDPTAVEEECDYGDTALGSWHFYWMSVGRIRGIFSTEFRLQDNQIINHFPNHYELTRKDLMYKNIKRYLRERTVNAQVDRKLILSTALSWKAAESFAEGPAALSPLKGDVCPSLYPAGSRKKAENCQNPVGDGLATGDSVAYYCFADGVPVTYNIPNDMSMFIEEFKRCPGSTWIVKPTSRSQGKGIFLINRIQQLVQWLKKKDALAANSSGGGPSNGSCSGVAGINSSLGHPRSHKSTSGLAATTQDTVDTNANTSSGDGKGDHHCDTKADASALPNCPNASQSVPTGTFIVSRYITNPLLIGGKKFDLRLYVLVTSFKPLMAYFHSAGFARFCATKYTGHRLSEQHLGSHLTNVALQKGDEHYNATHGGKWSFANLLLYVQARYGPYVAASLNARIEFLIFHSLQAVSTVMLNDKHCFELYGYDVLIDSDIMPHLIEVNASPSLSTTTTSDRLLKEEVLTDMLRIVLPPDFPSTTAMPYWEHRLRSDLTTQLPTDFKLLNF